MLSFSSDKVYSKGARTQQGVTVTEIQTKREANAIEYL